MTRAQRRREIRALLRGSVRGRAGDVRRLVAWSTVEAAPALLSGLLVAHAIDDGFLAGRTGTGLVWLAVLAVAVLLGGWATAQAFRAMAALTEPFRDTLATRTVEAALARATGSDAQAAGAARLTQQVEIAREAYASVLIVVQQFLVTTVAAIVGLLALLPALLLFVVPPLVAGLALFAAALPGMAARQRTSILADERVAEAAGTVAAGLRDIAACGGEDHAGRLVGVHIDAQARATHELARFTALRTTAVAVGGWLPVVLILAGGPWLLRHGATTGELVGGLTYVAQALHGALQTLVRGLGNTGLWLVVSLGRIVEATSGKGGRPALPARPPVGEGSVAGPSLAPVGSDLELRRVTFRYAPDAAPVVDGLDLGIPAGDHLAVVGPSGVGKSTLAGLCAGLLAPEAGTVRLGGTPLGALDPRQRARHRVLIPQEAYVFAGTLGENLAYLRPDAGPDDLDRVVSLLGIRPLVERLGGFGAVLDPAALSAGERQLVALARAYASPAPVAILDEATCHLDPATEARVEAAFAERPGTLVVVAHRMSSAVRARRVLVMDAGAVAVGSHAELIERSGLYRDLVGRWDAAATVAPPPPPEPVSPLPRRRRGIAWFARKRPSGSTALLTARRRR